MKYKQRRRTRVFLRRHLHIVISLYGVSIICIIFSLHAGLRGSFPAFFGRPLAVQ